MIPKGLIETVQKAIGKVMPVKISKICQDVLIPVQNAEEFFEWYDTNIGLYPMYNVPVQAPYQTSYYWKDTTPYIDFGIGYGIVPDKSKNQNDMCRIIELQMMKLHGTKLPYTNTNLTRSEFWKGLLMDLNFILEVLFKKLLDRRNLKRIFSKQRFFKTYPLQIL